MARRVQRTELATARFNGLFARMVKARPKGGAGHGTARLIGLRLADLTNSEKQEITRKIDSVLDSVEGSGQAGKAIGLNSAARAIVHRVAAGRGFSHETSGDKGEMFFSMPKRHP